MSPVGVKGDPFSRDTITVEKIAARYAILPETVAALRRKRILPPPDAAGDRWQPATIDNIIEQIHREGLPSGSFLTRTLLEEA